MACVNCGEDLPAERYHVYLPSNEVVELALCEGCRHKLVTADWVSAVI